MSKKLVVHGILTASLIFLAACSSTPQAAPSISASSTSKAVTSAPTSTAPASSSSVSASVPASSVVPPPTSTSNPPPKPSAPPSSAAPPPAKPAAMDFTKIGAPVLVSSQFNFTEGPVWDKAHNVFLFTDVNANKLYQLALPTTVTVYKDPSLKTYSLVFDKDGSLLTAEGGLRQVTRTLADKTVKVLADKYQDKALNAPNDLVVRDDSTIYFTDPIFGPPPSPVGVDFMGLYRISPTGELTLEGKFTTPNGLGLSPDQKTLYMASTMTNQVMAFSIAADGSTSNGKKFVDAPNADGMKVDASGNVWVACKDGVYVFSPEGTTLASIKTTTRPTNLAFGGPDGKTLLITSDAKNLYTVALP